MTEAAPPAAENRPSKRAMIAWLAGILLVLALVWPAWSVVTTFLQTREVMSVRESGGISSEEAVARLGGPERALRQSRLYLRLPDWMAPARRAVPEILQVCGEPAVDALIDALSDRDAWVRSSAAVHLAYMVPRPGKAIPVLIRNLADPSATARSSAAGALAEFGREAVAARPGLIKGLGDTEERMRGACSYALISVGADASAVPALSQCLRDADEFVREHAAEVLGNLGAEAKDAVLPLAQVVAEDRKDRVREYAAAALGEIGPGAGEAIPTLEKALKDNYYPLAKAAEEALKKIRGGEQK